MGAFIKEGRLILTYQRKEGLLLDKRRLFESGR